MKGYKGGVGVWGACLKSIRAFVSSWWVFGDSFSMLNCLNLVLNYYLRKRQKQHSEPSCAITPFQKEGFILWFIQMFWFIRFPKIGSQVEEQLRWLSKEKQQLGGF